MTNFWHCETDFFRRNGLLPKIFPVDLSLITSRADSLLSLRSIITSVEIVLTRCNVKR